MRRTHLPPHANILKRLLIHAAAFNLGLIIRSITETGTPRQMRESARALVSPFSLRCKISVPWERSLPALPLCRSNESSNANAYTSLLSFRSNPAR
jgi:hypothetical protein